MAAPRSARRGRPRACAASPGATGKTAVGRPAAAHTTAYRPSSGSMIDARPRVVPERRDPADREAGQLVGLAGRRTADVAPPDDRGEPLQVDAIGARHEAHDRLELAVLASGHEYQRLDDLRQLGTDRPSRLAGGMGRVGENGDVEGHALAGGGVEHPEDGRVLQRGGHGARIAAAMRLGSRPWMRSSSTGTAPSSTRCRRSSTRTCRSSRSTACRSTTRATAPRTCPTGGSCTSDSASPTTRSTRPASAGSRCTAGRTRRRCSRACRSRSSGCPTPAS